MITRNFEITIRIPEQDYIPSTFKVIQNDRQVYSLAIKITDGITEINYAQIHHATITFAKTDGNVVQGNMIVGGSSLTYMMGINEIACPGSVLASIQLFGTEGERLTSARFRFEVVGDLITPSAVQSTSEFPILQQALRDVEAAQAAANNINAAIDAYNAMLRTSNMILKSPVADYAAIASTYQEPQVGWVTKTLDDSKAYRYDGSEWIWFDTIQSSAYDALVARIQELDSGIVNTPSITFGNNLIKHTGKVPVYPEITFKGKHYVNLLGKDGDCEDATKFTVNGGTLPTAVLDNTVKVFGNNSVKISGASTSGAKMLPVTLVAEHYYFMSAYIKTDGVSVGRMCSRRGDSTYWLGEDVNSPSSFTRTGKKFIANGTELGVGAQISNLNSGANYANVDGIMIVEITAEEYNNKSEIQLLNDYPYVESYGALQNPCFENRRYNLVRNGNCEEGIAWWKPELNSVLSVDNNGFAYTGNQYATIYQRVRVKSNTDYFIKCFVGGDNTQFYIMASDGITVIYHAVKNFTFNTGANTEIVIKLRKEISDAVYIGKIMLVEGTTAPTEYKSCDQQDFALEGQFTDDDEITIKDCNVSGLLWWKHRTLFGKDYAWQFSTYDYTGFKAIQIPNFASVFYGAKGDNSIVCIKYDGKFLLPESTLSGTYDQVIMNTIYSSHFFISVSDADSGWAESINPNDSEVKAFMNGWKATANDGTRYTEWVSIVDGITTPMAQTIDFVSTNIAPGYEGYRLHYKLQNPEPVTDINVPVKGTVWDVVPGDNYITVDSGMILCEVANPFRFDPLNVYLFNNIVYGYGNAFKYRTEKISAVYKNQIYDSAFVWGAQNINSYGNMDGSILINNFDVNATYTVDYQILKTFHAQSFGSLTFKYAQDIFTAISGIAGALEEKQQHSNILDKLNYMGIYEEMPAIRIIQRSVRSQGYSLRSNFYFTVPKEAIPIVTIKLLAFQYYNDSGSNVVNIPLVDTRVTAYGVTSRGFLLIVAYVGSDTIIQNALRDNGGSVVADVIADCRGRI